MNAIYSNLHTSRRGDRSSKELRPPIGEWRNRGEAEPRGVMAARFVTERVTGENRRSPRNKKFSLVVVTGDR